MKIVCTLNEYTRIIRKCSKAAGECSGCVLEGICGNNILEDAVEFEIISEEEIKEGS